MLGSICLSLSDMAAATVASTAASTTSWKWRTLMLNKQHMHGVLHRLFPLYKYETYTISAGYLIIIKHVFEHINRSERFLVV